MNATVEAFEATMRAFGLLMPPSAMMFDDSRDPPAYFGSVVCREFDRGEDAERAIAGMGVLPAVLGATRLVVAWEHGDLCVAQELPGQDFPRGLVVVDAGPARHCLYWRSMRLTAAAEGEPPVLHWGEPVCHPGDVVLPAPMAHLLAVWRANRAEDLVETLGAMMSAGYDIRRPATAR